MARRRKSGVTLTERDHALLLGLWKWKGATTAALAEEFFNGRDSDAAYGRLRKLASCRYVELVPLRDTGGHLWSLDRNGFNQIRNSLPILREAGFRSEAVDHDYLCTAMQRGPWLSALPAGMEQVSEQELRRCHADHLPQWVPSSNIHRPDGYSRTLLLGKSIIIAFEIELNRKRRSDYDLVAHFYQQTSEIYRVVWLARNASDARWFHNKIRVATPEDYLMHLFVLLPDFLRQCWEAPILLGHESGHSLSHVLCREVSQSPLNGETPSILDRRKRPYSSIICRATERPRFCNRMALSAIPHSSSPRSPSASINLHSKSSQVPNQKPYGGNRP